MKIGKTQPIIGLILVVLIAVFGKYLSNSSDSLTLYLITGVLLGYVLTRSRYGFAGGIKRIYFTGEGGLTKALLIMFAVSIVAAAGIHWGAAADGAVPAFRAAATDAIIPGTTSVIFFNYATVIGGFLFGVGMMLGGGCASGTLTDLGEGFFRAFITLCFFVLGSMPGYAVQKQILETDLGQIGARIYLPDVFGYIGTVLLSLLLLLGLYVLTRRYEESRKRMGYYQETVYEENEKPLKEEQGFKLFSYQTYHKFFVERWSFLTGGLLLAVLFIFIINTTGKSWGVTSAFNLWGVAIFHNLGFDFSPVFNDIVDTANKGVLNDNGSIRNIGIILGSTLALLLAGRFRFDFDFRFKDTMYYALGGFLMGFGARLAGGCNIGALYSGIGNLSLSGWVFMATLILGGISALKFYEGKVNVIPTRDFKCCKQTVLKEEKINA
ncbi:YeeE/YedE family protein [Thermoactinomyces mirandus]|uniref:YeeE/YedE family protein n=1 Tax=Thermoactinomyces mirandus TaxID=2756294 RepID=A0A7W1XTQ7_9BACL|nr:YeeE/YedE family protein [Thermoactinomyces mirandus]MBA4603046.1 YeeE/YedE family protein [Thermoactinomyces mirandus]